MSEVAYQSKPRNLAVPAVFLIIPGWDGSVLLMLRRGTGYMDGMWDLPSGHIEPGELPTQAMVREAKEEVGVLVARKNLTLVHTSYRPKHDQTGDRADYVFKAEKWHRKPKVCEPDKCERLDWFHPNHHFPENVIPHVREFLKFWKKGVGFSEFDVKWLKDNGAYAL